MYSMRTLDACANFASSGIPKRAAANLRNHGVSFEDAKTVFADESARLIDDPDHSVDEDRFILLGLSSSLRMLVVCQLSSGWEFNSNYICTQGRRS